MYEKKTQMRPRGVFGESCGRLEPETRTKVDEDVAKGRRGTKKDEHEAKGISQNLQTL